MVIRADVCPIGINTGALIKHQKMEHSMSAEEAALDVARKWAEVEKPRRASRRPMSCKQ